ncbi:MAG: SCO family protein [bacterium]|nr:SCO family protein [bacterium]
MRRIVVFIWMLGLLLWMPEWAAAQSQSGLPTVLQEVGIDQRLGDSISLDLMFQDETGAQVRLGDYFGERPVVLALVYYECPMLCTQVLNGLLSSIRTLSFSAGEEFEVVTVSFDPADTPELAAAKKAEYIKQYGREGAAAGWHFLTGDPASIDALTEAVGFRYVADPASGQFAHASAIMVLTPEGELARYFYGIEYPPRDLRLGLIEASKGEIGLPVLDAVLLYCFHYDPITGKYGMVIMNVLRLAGVATVLVLGTFMVVMLRRDRKKQAAVYGHEVLN